jgi:hypothetical protein
MLYHKHITMDINEAKKKIRDFNLTAMKSLIDENGFLNSKYDKLAVNAEERFGYHWNEVICNVLFNKYVKPNEKLYGRYLSLKKAAQIEKERTDYKEIRPDITPVPKDEPIKTEGRKFFLKKPIKEQKPV